MTSTIPVFYDNRMAVLHDTQPSPSAKKPAVLIEQWQAKKYPIHFEPITPLAQKDFYNAHQKQHVDAIFALQKPNGMETYSQELCDTLPWTSGSLLSAAHYVLADINRPVACSPTSGFHHAEYQSSMGYCTFNGLMLTAAELLSTGKAKKIGILDCDQHYGNGTDDIVRHLKLEDSVVHITAQKDYWPVPRYRDEFFKRLPGFLQQFTHCDILLYQAGADCHINDPYGGFLSSEDMRVRDRQVFEFCAKLHLPVVWNLAGGYQEDTLPNGEVSIQKVLTLHNATMEECVRVFLK